MANSKYEYVRSFERPDPLLPGTFIVVRIDGRGFHRLSDRYDFVKPNDKRALDLMNHAAAAVLQDLPDVVLAYGVSDEFSFVFERRCTLFDRRESKIVTTVVSTFTAHYVHHWPVYFPETPLNGPLPTFDGRAVLYPTISSLRDYLAWRQVNALRNTGHINNLYNTTFWALVQQGGMTTTEGERHLQGTDAAAKNEILFSRFGINYNNEPEMFRKGSIVTHDMQDALPPNSNSIDEEQAGLNVSQSKTQQDKERKRKIKAKIVFLHVDLIKDEFWTQRPWLLSR